jgi:hypothetical protein
VSARGHARVMAGAEARSRVSSVALCDSAAVAATASTVTVKYYSLAAKKRCNQQPIRVFD